jgi:hypothetical protein
VTRNHKPARNAPASPWRPPTRRAFIAMLGATLGAAAAALAVRPAIAPELQDGEPGERRRRGSKTIWIGHC